MPDASACAETYQAGTGSGPRGVELGLNQHLPIQDPRNLDSQRGGVEGNAAPRRLYHGCFSPSGVFQSADLIMSPAFLKYHYPVVYLERSSNIIFKWYIVPLNYDRCPPTS
jgi:hypothetical protein